MAWTITALSKKTEVPAGTLRYWERLGLLPRAARTHTGYRLFAAEALQYVEFVRKSKRIGLSLRQMHRVLEAARNGQSPCPEVERWTRARLSKIEEQIRELQGLQRRLRILSRDFGDIPRDRDRSGELCTLVVGLPEEKKFRKQKDGKSACSDNRCEGLQTKNGQRKKTSW